MNHNARLRSKVCKAVEVGQRVHLVQSMDPWTVVKIFGDWVVIEKFDAANHLLTKTKKTEQLWPED